MIKQVKEARLLHLVNRIANLNHKNHQDHRDLALDQDQVLDLIQTQALILDQVLAHLDLMLVI
jgi:hypothetical protein